MNDRPTPETDAEVIICHGIPDGFNPPERSYTSSKFARKLERERDEARDIGEKLSKQGLEMMDENRTIKRERDEAREELKKLTGTHLSVALSERDDALNQIQGWENKWKAAVEMAAIAENKVSNLEDQVDLAMKTIKRLEANQP